MQDASAGIYVHRTNTYLNTAVNWSNLPERAAPVFLADRAFGEPQGIGTASLPVPKTVSIEQLRQGGRQWVQVEARPSGRKTGDTSC